ncbi:MAG: sigma 54-interacting transcriptional regulator, partial [Planctomycetota bacterium]
MRDKRDSDSTQGIVPDINRDVESKRLRCSPANKGRETNFQLVGCSDALTSILDTVTAIASRKCPVIITGETGVGKEMVARQIHLSSDRADKVFVPVDCTTLTGQLFESQLFGHVRGAFTGA